MRGGRQQRIEALVDYSAAALFGGAAGYAAFMLLSHSFGSLELDGLVAGAATVAFVPAACLLRRIGRSAPQFEIRAFRMADLEVDELEELLLTEEVELLLTEQVELVLTDADRLHPPKELSGELVLDDILGEFGPDSRVVRLFDPAAMPTPGQLDARIQQHLRQGDFPAAHDPIAPPDASQALHDALAELRRSLR